MTALRLCTRPPAALPNPNPLTLLHSVVHRNDGAEMVRAPARRPAPPAAATCIGARRVEVQKGVSHWWHEGTEIAGAAACALRMQR